MANEKTNAGSTRLQLDAEAVNLFQSATSSRNLLGINSSLRNGFVRSLLDYDTCDPESKCSGESCDSDDAPVFDEGQCSIEDAIDNCRSISPFDGMATLLTTVKKYEYIALVENAYSQMGNKPFSLKSQKTPALSKEEKEKASKSFFSYLDSFLKTNEVRIDEVADAFEVSTLVDVGKELAKAVRDDADNRAQDALAQNEGILERIFERADLMGEYMRVMVDTTEYPIGVLWCDDKALKKKRVIKSGKMAFNTEIQCDANRVDPCYFWMTDDHKIGKPGRAVFKLVEMSEDNLRMRASRSLCGSRKLSEKMDAFLDDNEDGFRNTSGMLFTDTIEKLSGMYDIIVCRGKFKREHLEEYDVVIPKVFKESTFVPCELYIAGTSIVSAKVFEYFDEEMGVYTTCFRDRCDSKYGFSLHDFVYPFSVMYEAAIKGIDESMGKTTGSLIQVDLGVLEHPDEYLTRDKNTGEVTIDLSGNTVVEFDSTRAFQAPNFKGVPISVTQLPSDLGKLLPVIDFIFQQLEKISGIPSILVNSTNISSALRTTDNFNAAFAASAKVIKALLRAGETRVLKPAIHFFFDAKAMSGDFGDFLVEAEPEILLSDTLTRESNNDNDLLEGVITLSKLGSGLIPPEKIAGLLNTVGREVYNLQEDLVPGAGTLDTKAQAQGSTSP